MFSSESDVSMPTSPVYDRPFALLIEDWVSDLEDESEGEPMPTQKAPSFVHNTEHVKPPRPFVKPVEHPVPAENLRKEIPKFRGHRHSRNRKACFVRKSLTHLIKDCDYCEKKMVQKHVRNHAIRGNHQHYARMTHLNPYRHVVSTAVLTRSRLVPLNVARPVNTVVPQTKVQHQRPTTHGQSTTCFERQRSYRQWLLKTHDKDISYLSDFEEINRGYVAFGENPKGGKITRKGKIRTGKLDFDDVYFVKELKFNLFSVSQMCDMKNSVLFLDTECGKIVVAIDFVKELGVDNQHVKVINLGMNLKDDKSELSILVDRSIGASTGVKHLRPIFNNHQDNGA
nr:ribonuclease H-like domain-containing protein [Tanacetum cinerariifolium]